MSIFSKVNVWRDRTERSPAGQMALDEAILRSIVQQSGDFADLRFYQLPEGSVTMGFFMPMEELRDLKSTQEESRPGIVRRLTGGGIVSHGDDITFSLAVGKGHPLSSAATVERYRVIHEMLRDSLVECDIYPDATLVPVSSDDSQAGELSCFSKPVGWDVLERNTGKKIAGGAQRRSNGAWLHQGTVQVPGKPDISAKWTELFAKKLGAVENWNGEPEIEVTARELETSRYSTSEWNNRV